VVTRSVRDTAAILDLLAGPEPGDLDALERPAAPYAAEGDPGLVFSHRHPRTRQ